MAPSRREGGFGPLDTLALLALLGLLVGIFAPKLTARARAARDAHRLRDMERIRLAIEGFRAEHGRWPEPARSAAHGGWDVSHDGDFLPELVRAGFLPEVPRDPLDDETHHYRYTVYEAGCWRCVGEEPFYVLGLRAFESAEIAALQQGGFRCAERDWGLELAWVRGGGAAER